MRMPLGIRAGLQPLGIGKLSSPAERILSYNPIAFWPQWDPVGTTVAVDFSGNGRNGSHTNVTLGQTGIGDGNTCAGYDGSTSYTNVYSAAFAAAFSGPIGSLVAAIQYTGSWTDGVERRFVAFVVDGSNFAMLRKSTINNRVDWYYRASVTQSLRGQTSFSPTTFFWMGLSWADANNGNSVRTYLDGAEVGTAMAAGAWVGALASNQTCLGAGSTVPGNVHSGCLALTAVFDYVLPPAAFADMVVI